MNTICVYHPDMRSYDFGRAHPLRPERFTLAVELMGAVGLLGEDGPSQARLTNPPSATLADLELVHGREYIDTVRDASGRPSAFRPRRGLGPGDTPAVAGIHEAAALIVGGTMLAVDAVLGDVPARAFAPAGGLHHAHADRAAGFCVYNDPAIGITAALRERPGIRIAYVDIDAHHGDGVQEAFYEYDDVLTISVHESGAHLFPGTGFAEEIGAGEGLGFSVNVPMPAGATDACYEAVCAAVIEPALTAFAPDAVVMQCGADAHHADPLTHLGMTLPGYRSLVASVISHADEVCEGRIACTGGGGYGTYSVVPRAWTCVMAELLGVSPAEQLPESWRHHASSLSGEPSVLGLTQDVDPTPADTAARLLEITQHVVERVRVASPLLG